MRFKNTLQAISWGLLLYFAVFIIPPVSSFSSPVKQRIARADQLSMQQDHRQTRLFLVDILVWFKLKQSRQSETLTIAPYLETAAAGSTIPADSLTALLPEQQQLFGWSARTQQHAISGHLSRSSEIFFARSGISPP
jgi:hypothetical protein